MAKPLALFGGPRAVTVPTTEQWSRPVQREKEVVCRVIEEGFLSGTGRSVVKEFEERFREFIGCRYVFTTSHGHTALAAAFFAAGLGAGDEFITPTVGYLGSYAGALHMGARPVFCEIDPQTLLMDPEDVKRRITSRTRVLAPIHFNGRPCDMDRLLAIAREHRLIVVEDAAHAHGSEWDGVKIGNVGHIACFSLQGVVPGGKPVAGGEGGIVATNDRELYERALIYSQLHREGVPEELTHPVYRQLDGELLGWKWRAHPLALAIGLVSLDTLPYRLDHFEANREALFAKLEGLPGVRPVRNYPKARGVELYGGLKFVYEPETLEGLPIERFIEALQAEGVPVRWPALGHLEHLRALYTKELPGLWGPGHPGPANQALPRYQEGDFPISEGMRDRVFGLRGWIQPAKGLLDQIAEAFHKVVEQYKKLLQPHSRTARA